MPARVTPTSHVQPAYTAPGKGTATENKKKMNGERVSSSGFILVDFVQDRVHYRLLTVLITVMLYLLVMRAIFNPVESPPSLLNEVQFTSTLPSVAFLGEPIPRQPRVATRDDRDVGMIDQGASMSIKDVFASDSGGTTLDCNGARLRQLAGTIEGDRVAGPCTPEVDGMNAVSDKIGVASFEGAVVHSGPPGLYGVEVQATEERRDYTVSDSATLVMESLAFSLEPLNRAPESVTIGQALTGAEAPSVRVTGIEGPLAGRQVHAFSWESADFFAAAASDIPVYHVEGGRYAVLHNAVSTLSDADGVATFDSLTVAGSTSRQVYIMFYCEGVVASWNDPHARASALSLPMLPRYVPPTAVRSTVASVSVTTAPSSTVTEGSAFGTQPVVRVTDGDGNGVAGKLVIAQIEMADRVTPPLGLTTRTYSNHGGITGSGELRTPAVVHKALTGAVSVATDANGDAYFDELGMQVQGPAGTYRLRFVCDAVSSEPTGDIDVQTLVDSITVQRLPSHIPRRGEPEDVYETTATQPAVVRVVDAAGNGVHGKTVSVRVVGASARLDGAPPDRAEDAEAHAAVRFDYTYATTAVTGADGFLSMPLYALHVDEDALDDTAGVSLTFESDGVSVPVTTPISVASDSIADPGVCVRLRLVDGDVGNQATVGTEIDGPFVVQAVNGAGQGVEGARIEVFSEERHFTPSPSLWRVEPVPDDDLSDDPGFDPLLEFVTGPDGMATIKSLLVTAGPRTGTMRLRFRAVPDENFWGAAGESFDPIEFGASFYGGYDDGALYFEDGSPPPIGGALSYTCLSDEIPLLVVDRVDSVEIEGQALAPEAGGGFAGEVHVGEVEPGSSASVDVTVRNAAGNPMPGITCVPEFVQVPPYLPLLDPASRTFTEGNAGGDLVHSSTGLTVSQDEDGTGGSGGGAGAPGVTTIEITPTPGAAGDYGIVLNCAGWRSVPLRLALESHAASIAITTQPAGTGPGGDGPVDVGMFLPTQPEVRVTDEDDNPVPGHYVMAQWVHEDATVGQSIGAQLAPAKTDLQTVATTFNTVLGTGTSPPTNNDGRATFTQLMALDAIPGCYRLRFYVGDGEGFSAVLSAPSDAICFERDDKYRVATQPPQVASEGAALVASGSGGSGPAMRIEKFSESDADALGMFAVALLPSSYVSTATGFDSGDIAAEDALAISQRVLSGQVCFFDNFVAVAGGCSDMQRTATRDGSAFAYTTSFDALKWRRGLDGDVMSLKFYSPLALHTSEAAAAAQSSGRTNPVVMSKQPAVIAINEEPPASIAVGEVFTVSVYVGIEGGQPLRHAEVTARMVVGGAGPIVTPDAFLAAAMGLESDAVAHEADSTRFSRGGDDNDNDDGGGGGGASGEVDVEREELLYSEPAALVPARRAARTDEFGVARFNLIVGSGRPGVYAVMFSAGNVNSRKSSDITLENEVAEVEIVSDVHVSVLAPPQSIGGLPMVIDLDSAPVVIRVEDADGAAITSSETAAAITVKVVADVEDKSELARSVTDSGSFGDDRVGAARAADFWGLLTGGGVKVGMKPVVTAKATATLDTVPVYNAAAGGYVLEGLRVAVQQEGRFRLLFLVNGMSSAASGVVEVSPAGTLSVEEQAVLGLGKAATCVLVLFVYCGNSAWLNGPLWVVLGVAADIAVMQLYIALYGDDGGTGYHVLFIADCALVLIGVFAAAAMGRHETEAQVHARIYDAVEQERGDAATKVHIGSAAAGSGGGGGGDASARGGGAEYKVGAVADGGSEVDTPRSEGRASAPPVVTVNESPLAFFTSARERSYVRYVRTFFSRASRANAGAWAAEEAAAAAVAAAEGRDDADGDGGGGGGGVVGAMFGLAEDPYDAIGNAKRDASAGDGTAEAVVMSGGAVVTVKVEPVVGTLVDRIRGVNAQSREVRARRGWARQARLSAAAALRRGHDAAAFFYPSRLLTALALSLLSVVAVCIGAFAVIEAAQTYVKELDVDARAAMFSSLASLERLFAATTTVDLVSDDETWLYGQADTLHGNFCDLADSLYTTFVLAAAVAIGTYGVAWAVLLTDFRVRALNARVGRFDFTPAKIDRQDADNFVGTAVSNSIVMFVVNIVIVVAILLPFVWEVTRDIIFTMWPVYLALLLPMLVNVLVRHVVGGRVLLDPWTGLIRSRWLHAPWDFFQIFLQVYTGVSKAFIRVLAVIGASLVALPRVDESPLPSWAERRSHIDSASEAYFSMVLQFNTYNNPVARVAAVLLVRGGAAYRTSVALGDSSPSQPHVMTVSRRRAFNRWHLAWMLYKHPSILKFRSRPAPMPGDDDGAPFKLGLPGIAGGDELAKLLTDKLGDRLDDEMRGEEDEVRRRMHDDEERGKEKDRERRGEVARDAEVIADERDLTEEERRRLLDELERERAAVEAALEAERKRQDDDLKRRLERRKKARMARDAKDAQKRAADRLHEEQQRKLREMEARQAEERKQLEKDLGNVAGDGGGGGGGGGADDDGASDGGADAEFDAEAELKRLHESYEHELDDLEARRRSERKRQEAALQAKLKARKDARAEAMRKRHAQEAEEARRRAAGAAGDPAALAAAKAAAAALRERQSREVVEEEARAAAEEDAAEVDLEDAVAAAEAAAEAQRAKIVAEHDKNVAKLRDREGAERRRQQAALQAKLDARKRRGGSGAAAGASDGAGDEGDAAAEAAALEEKAAAAQKAFDAEAELRRVRDEHDAEVADILAKSGSERRRQRAALEAKLAARRERQAKDAAAKRSAAEAAAAAAAAAAGAAAAHGGADAGGAAGASGAAASSEQLAAAEREATAAAQLALAEEAAERKRAAEAIADAEAAMQRKLQQTDGDLEGAVAAAHEAHDREVSAVLSAESAERRRQQAALEERLRKRRDRQAAALRRKQLAELEAAQVAMARNEADALIGVDDVPDEQQGAEEELYAEKLAEAVAGVDGDAGSVDAGTGGDEAATAALEAAAAAAAEAEAVRHRQEQEKAALEARQAAERQAEADRVRAEVDRTLKKYDDEVAALGDKTADERARQKERLQKQLAAREARRAKAMRRKHEREAAAAAAKHAEEGSEARAAQDTAKERKALALLMRRGNSLVKTQEVGHAIDAVMRKRHQKETTDLLARQYEERNRVLREALDELFDEKREAVAAALDRHRASIGAAGAAGVGAGAAGGASEGKGSDGMDDTAGVALALADDGDREDDGMSPAERSRALADIDATFTVRQREVEHEVLSSLEAKHAEAQFALRRRQLAEVTQAYESLAPDDVKRAFKADEAARQAAEVDEIKAQLDAERQERIASVAADQREAEERLRRDNEAEVARLRREAEAEAAAAKETGERALANQRKALLRRQKASQDRRLELAEAEEVTNEEKKRIMADFEAERDALEVKLKVERQRQARVLQRKLKRRTDRRARQARQRLAKQLAAEDALTQKKKAAVQEHYSRARAALTGGVVASKLRAVRMLGGGGKGGLAAAFGGRSALG